MNRVINDPDQVVEDMLQGILAAHPQLLQYETNPRVIAKRMPSAPGQVGIVTGGGSGHEPAFLGYVGPGLVDAVAVGEIFSSPTAKSFFDAFRAADQGAGVACLYGNYAGDNMNVKLAMKMAASKDLQVRTVVANDDVASAPLADIHKRRGVAGEIFMWKVGGAAAATGYDLDGVIRVAQKAVDQCRSIGAGLTPCTIPAVGKANFQIADGQMELGIGHHGEPGIEVIPIEPAAAMAERMLAPILADRDFHADEALVVLVSGLGATPVMELYIFYAEVERLLRARGLSIHRCYVGNYFTSLEMMGVTLTLLGLDAELRHLIDQPCRSIGLTQTE
ncbi:MULTISPECIES: dihydroxyacetone kinase subunit DhaK [unclassified Pseudomonas]|jgi:dihydroxyacetone kinase-like protein|uniref:dihydroxyacetone kinase subunit DhaK n=1 Tax=Pseudomonas TaxID=286 RepID=UPI0008771E0C|nr:MULTISPECIES: dihydroxyacetone kinase subunit DhaK [unclassified Pseudomonas]SCZ75681.1 dihydroxyacetone kinase, N-terminal domain [Pseudomonas sp. NFPP17]SDA38875.1 dihydroxyacetone kinase, N-terminal domain [Pseudomonas sp. NFPP15]SEK49867.1 dihydroxyacetone kinase, N-terminal domain [Pseudomonas sp. NFPP18]SFA68460.1 dihydroxyacetone kinase, N-terminal domain [Pseudomonas sp. NFPP13]SFT37466.1 dihydroxyacetone kinase, N-terminal domain [Pseudomonas sp. NFPP25]